MNFFAIFQIVTATAGVVNAAGQDKRYTVSEVIDVARTIAEAAGITEKNLFTVKDLTVSGSALLNAIDDFAARLGVGEIVIYEEK